MFGIVVLTITAVKNGFDIVWKIHQLHKAGVDKSVKDEIQEAAANFRSTVTNHYNEVVKGQK